jgi:hypothetical protein
MQIRHIPERDEGFAKAGLSGLSFQVTLDHLDIREIVVSER